MSKNRHQFESLRRLLMGCILVGTLAVASGGALAATDTPARSERPESADMLANQVAHDVFAGEAYWWKRTSAVQSTSAIGRFFSFVYQGVMLPILEQINRFLEWIFSWLFGGGAMGKGDWSNGVPFLWTIVAVLLLFAAWRIAALLHRRPVVPAALGGQAISDVLPQADQLLEQSQLAQARGDHRSAVRLALLSLLAWLQDRGRLKYDASRSNREYQQDLRRWPESATVFGAVAAPFERCWYGGRNLDALQVEEVIALCRNHFQVAKDPA